MILGVDTLGVYPLAGLWERADPSVTITAPTAVVTSTSTTFSFTYSSPVSRTQYSYQAQLRTQDGGTVLFDTGTVVSSSSSSLALSYLLSAGSTYQLWVRASDLFDTSDWDTFEFSVDISGVADYPDNELVGSVYEIAINGTGYMLSDDFETPVDRRQIVLDPPRLATSQTPFAEAVERYSFIGASSWTNGAGQRLRNRDDSDPQKFWDSEGINPFEETGLELLPAMVLSNSDTYATPMAVVVNGAAYVVTAAGELTHQAAPEGTATPFTITGASAPTDMTTDGTYWYYADGANIYRNSSAADPAGAWSTIDADLIEWTVDRITAVYDDGAGNMCVTTLAAAGTEEVAGGRFKYPDTTSIPAITGGDGYLWFAVNRSESSQIHYWQIGSSDTYATSGFTLPTGQRAVSLGFYLGNVFVLALEPLVGGTYRAVLYRCVPNNGDLSPIRVADWLTSDSMAQSGFAGDDRFVYFSWTGMTETNSYSGVGCVDLSSGGYAKWLSTTVTGAAYRPVMWGGRIAFGVSASGLWVEDTDLIASGWLESSISDLASGLTKVFDNLTASFEPLPNGGSIALEYTLDGGNSFTSAGSSAATAGLTSQTWDFELSGRSIGYRVTLGASATSPTLQNIQVKLHPLSLHDALATFPINCGDNVVGLNGADISYESTGMERYRALEALNGSRVRLQDVDWPTTNTATVWEVVDVRSEMFGVYDRQKNRRVDSGRAMVTLRRSA